MDDNKLKEIKREFRDVNSYTLKNEIVPALIKEVKRLKRVEAEAKRVVQRAGERWDGTAWANMNINALRDVLSEQ